MRRKRMTVHQECLRLGMNNAYENKIERRNAEKDRMQCDEIFEKLMEGEEIKTDIVLREWFTREKPLSVMEEEDLQRMAEIMPNT